MRGANSGVSRGRIGTKRSKSWYKVVRPRKKTKLEGMSVLLMPQGEQPDHRHMEKKEATSR